MKISGDMQLKLICPSTKSKLKKNGDCFESSADPRIRYPIVDGIPILINEEKSLFSIDDFMQRVNTTFVLQQNKWKKLLKG